MRLLIFSFLLLSAGIVLAQNNNPATADSKHNKGQVTVQGCVSRSNGDYILFQHDPGVTYELEASGKIKLRTYLGQRVEVTGRESPSLSTSSDAMTRTGSASAATITVSAIKTIEKECTAR